MSETRMSEQEIYSLLMTVGMSTKEMEDVMPQLIKMEPPEVFAFIEKYKEEQIQKKKEEEKRMENERKQQKELLKQQQVYKEEHLKKVKAKIKATQEENRLKSVEEDDEICEKLRTILTLCQY